MITMDEAIHAKEFHANGCTRTTGPRGGITVKQEVWRRNGLTQLWVTRPGEFKVSVKHGLYSYGYITHLDADLVHLPHNCPANEPVVAV